MKKRGLILDILTVLLICIAFTLIGCSADIPVYDTNNNKDSDDLKYLITRITDVPNGWSESDNNCYYYQVDTKIVYFGSSNLNSNYGVYLIELKSDKYDNYIYDEDTNEFIGVER